MSSENNKKNKENKTNIRIIHSKQGSNNGDISLEELIKIKQNKSNTNNDKNGSINYRVGENTRYFLCVWVVYKLLCGYR